MWVFHLRGNQRTSGELSRKEGGKIFGGGSRAPIAISLLVKNPGASQHGQIHFHDIGDYLSREDKLQTIERFRSVAGLSTAGAWLTVAPDPHGDWLKQRDESLGEFVALGDKGRNAGAKLFHTYSNGVKTQRDAWCFGSSKSEVGANMARMIGFYNAEADRFSSASAGLSKKQREEMIDDFLNADPRQISWTYNVKEELVKDRRFAFDEACLVPSTYRPFTKQWLYYNRRFNERVYQMPRIFPDATAANRIICISAPGFISGFTILISDAPTELCVSAMKGGTQCFPLYLYDDSDTEAGAGESENQGALFKADAQPATQRNRRDALTDEGLAHFKAAYPGEKISKEDVFYYVYGLLHSPDYRERYADNLGKELPRIPCVKTAADFHAFSQAGRDLAELHLNYETVAMYPANIDTGGKTLTDADYRVEKMRHGKKGKDKDLSTVKYNSRITVSGIPPQAYDYVVNGKPAIDWVMERQCVKTDKASGIVNDANDWAIETMQNPKYPLELLLRVVTVSLETMSIVHALPKLDI